MLDIIQKKLMRFLVIKNLLLKGGKSMAYITEVRPIIMSCKVFCVSFTRDCSIGRM